MENEKNSKLLIYAKNYNFLRTLNCMAYGTETDFISDKLKWCLEHNIISKECSEDDFWKDFTITNYDEDITIPDQYTNMTYTDTGTEKQKSKYKFEFRKVTLPEGWKLEIGCECDRNMNPSNFMVYDSSNKIVKTLAYFPSFDKYNIKHPLLDILDKLDEKDPIELASDN